MPTLEQETTLRHGACLPLRFLVDPKSRSKRFTGLESFSESAYFHRLYELFWFFRDSEGMQSLNGLERKAAAEFTQVFNSLPWKPIDGFPHISELMDDDLSPLVPSAQEMLRMLEAGNRFVWLRRLSRVVAGLISKI